MRTTTGLRVDVIAGTHELSGFEDEWRDFHRRVPPATPFQTPDWIVTWWSHFGSGTLRIFVFRDEHCIVGVLPCFLHPWNGRRQLTLIGTGLSDYLDPVIDERHADGIVESIHGELRAFSDWDVCDWQDLSDDTILQQLGNSREDTPCAELLMGSRFETLLATRPRYIRRNIRHCIERAARLGEVQFEVSPRADCDLLQSLIEQHAARWKQSGESGVIAANHAEGFLWDVARALERSGSLQIFALRLNREVVATILAMKNQATIFEYITAFHPGYRSYGFGNRLLSLCLQYTCERSYGWNFLRGTEQYKFDWGARIIPKRRVFIER